MERECRVFLSSSLLLWLEPVRVLHGGVLCKCFYPLFLLRFQWLQELWRQMSPSSWILNLNLDLISRILILISGSTTLLWKRLNEPAFHAVLPEPWRIPSMLQAHFDEGFLKKLKSCTAFSKWVNIPALHASKHGMKGGIFYASGWTLFCGILKIVAK